MKKILVTGGTVFVSKYITEYYVSHGFDVYVLNRNTREQLKDVKLIIADRHNLQGILSNEHFDLIIDTAYSAEDVELLLNDVGSFTDYVLISSSAVYPENQMQPFIEETKVGENKYWGKYGSDKIEAENLLIKRFPKAYIIRPPYLYGPYNNVYRESFIFDCAMMNRKFYLPGSGEITLQFFHIHDLCKFIDILMVEKPKQHIFNVGNKELISIKEWVTLCYEVVGKKVEFVNVKSDIDQRNYFSFYNYQYTLDVSKQYQLMKNTISLQDGITESFNWYKNNLGSVNRKSFIEYIDNNLIKIIK